MDKISQFKQYMISGHGRCFSLLDDDKEIYRETVMYGCLNDITYDWQCEGSRGLFMYNLVLEYDDYDYFLKAAIEKFLSPSVNDDWHLISHLCDFIALFAYDYGDETAIKSIEAKYSELHDLIMTLRWSRKAHDILQCCEYIAIVIMQNSDFDRAIGIFSDIGAYFLRRRRVPDDDLHWHFEWFLSYAQSEYGDNFMTKRLGELCSKSNKIRRFVRVMSFKRKKYRRRKSKMTAQEFIKKAYNGEITRSDIIKMRQADDNERIKLAETVKNENDPEVQAELLKAFTISRGGFPLDPDILAGYAESDNESLRNTAIEALLYIHSEKSHDIALKHLKENYSTEALMLFIDNYADNDKELLMNYLNNIVVDCDEGDWHSIVLTIRENAEKMPIEAIMFVYEKSICSCCRETAVNELIKRNLLTCDLLDECLWDSNSDIRETAEKLNMGIRDC